MKELSLNILDIAENSTRAGAALVQILLEEDEEKFSFSVLDNGCGMTQEFLKKVTDPFSTSRTTRKVGFGIPFLKLAAEQTGGFIELESSSREEFPDRESGTAITAHFYKNHIDFVPLGDIVSSVCTLIQGSPQTDFVFSHQTPNGKVTLDTREVRQALGGDIPLNDPSVLVWIRDYLKDGYDELKNTKKENF